MGAPQLSEQKAAHQIKSHPPVLSLKTVKPSWAFAEFIHVMCPPRGTEHLECAFPLSGPGGLQECICRGCVSEPQSVLNFSEDQRL